MQPPPAPTQLEAAAALPVAAPVAEDRASLSAMRAQALYNRVLFTFAPGVVAAGMTLVRGDGTPSALTVLVCLLATGLLLWPKRAPMHLMPVARNVVRLLAPIAGIALALAPGLVTSAWVFDPSEAVAPLVGALLIVVLARVLETRFDSDSPVRLSVIGGPTLAGKLAKELEANNIRRFRVVGYVTSGGEHLAPVPDLDLAPVPNLGRLDDIRQIVQQNGIHLFAVGPDTPRLHVFEETAAACLDLPVRMVEASAFYESVLGHVPIGAINSAWFQCIMHPRYSPTSPLTKRLLDLSITLPVAVLVLLPLLPVVALLGKLEDRGPVFYRQRRVGERGRAFDMLKFRTMRVDADALRDQGTPEEKLITRLGRVLRATHMNELPQLFNVVKGEMTLVGPRPEPLSLVEGMGMLVPHYHRRTLVKPGITGWAQVRCGYAGDRVGTAWKMCHDLFYLKQRSVIFDILILLQTFQVLVERSDDSYDRPHEEFVLGQTGGGAGR